MRILVHDYAGHPFQAQLSRELARRGHVVQHAFRAKSGGRSGALERTTADPDTLVFSPIRLGRRASVAIGLRNRLRHEIVYARAATRRARAFRPDVVISSNTPLYVQYRLLSAARRSDAAFVYWMQDLISASQIRRLRRRSAVIGLPAAKGVRWIERTTLAGSDAVVAVTPAFQPTLERYRVNPERIVTIPNWAPLDELVPVERNNAWAATHGLTSKTVFLYAGSLGLKHGPARLIELAQALPDELIVVVAEGPGADSVRHEAARLGLANVNVVPSQPYQDLSNVLGSADVLVALLDDKGAEYSVPSKILSYLCAARPVLAGIPERNYAAQVLAQSGGGVVVEPDDVDDWQDAARRLAVDEELRARLARDGRAYALRMFDIERIGDEFEAVINGAIARRGA